MPAISPEALYGAVHLTGDGHLDPHTATHAVAEAARSLGVRIRTGVRVTGFELGSAHDVRRVLTDAGPIDTELVVNAAGMWAPQVAAMVGAFVPSTPVDHQHIALKAVPGAELPKDMPCFRDPDNLVYGKSEHGGMVFGGYEADPPSRWEDGVPWDHAAQPLPPDYERFAPLMAGAIRRFPFLGDAEAVRLVCHPDAMTPDANPLLGPVPGVRGFWVAAGLSLNGFGGGGGIGRAMAGWITAGRSGRRHRPVPGVAVRGCLSRPRVRRRPRPRDLRRLLPAALPVRRRRRGAAEATLAAPWAAPGRRRRLRDEGRLGTGRPPRAGASMATRRSGPASVGMGRAAMVRARLRRGAGGPRASGHHRPDLVRQDRHRGSRRAGAPRPGRRQPNGSARRQRHVHAVPRRARRHGRRRHRDPARRGPVPGGDRGRVRRVGPRLAAESRGRGALVGVAPRRQRRDRDDRAVGTAGARHPGRHDTGRRRRCRASGAPGGRGGRRRGAGPRVAHQLRRRARLGAERRGGRRGDRYGMPCGPPVGTPGSSRSGTARSMPCGWRRAIATTAST